jgi:hypothetical protein
MNIPHSALFVIMLSATFGLSGGATAEPKCKASPALCAAAANLAVVFESDRDKGHGNNRVDGQKVDDQENPGASKKYSLGEDPLDGNSGWGHGGIPVSQ